MLTLVTREEKDAKRISRVLSERKLNTLNVPLFSVSYHKDIKINLRKIQSIIFSSSNGVRALSKLTKKRTIKVYVIGDRTFHVAKRHGFKNVINAKGNSESLCRLVNNELNPKNGKLYYAAGKAQAVNIKKQLERKGFSVRKGILYEIVARKFLPKKIKDALIKKKIHFVLFFSPKTADILIKLVIKNNLQSCFSSIDAFVFSRPVKDVISDIRWKSINVAKKPNLESMLQAIDAKVKARKR